MKGGARVNDKFVQPDIKSNDEVTINKMVWYWYRNRKNLNGTKQKDRKVSIECDGDIISNK